MDTKIIRIKNKLKFNQIAKKHSLFIVSAKSGHLNNGHVKAFKNMIKTKKKFIFRTSADVS